MSDSQRGLYLWLMIILFGGAGLFAVVMTVVMLKTRRAFRLEIDKVDALLRAKKEANQ